MSSPSSLPDRRPRTIVLDPADHVAVAIVELLVGGEVEIDGEVVAVLERIPAGHKIARVDIEEGADVLKYGEAIGHATVPIARGAHVHVHNLVGNRLAVSS